MTSEDVVELKSVFEPIAIGGVRVPNRVVRTAHDTGFAKPDIGDDFIAYHLARAQGGCGLSILEAASVHPSSRLDLALFGDNIVSGYRRLVDAVSPYGMRVFQQLWHGGNLYPAFDGSPPWAISDVPGFWGLVGNVMSTAEVVELTRAFVDAALRCQEGGLDGVEVHACHGYIFSQFLSAHYNNRNDEYGGSFENRSRFLFETLRGIRAAVRPSFAVGVRLGSSEMPGGVSVDDNKRLLVQMQAEGLIDFVDVSKGDYFRMDTMVGAMQQPTGYELSTTAEIASVATVPRIVTGRFRTLEEADQVIRSGEADLVSLVRAQIADPDLVRKTREGRVESVRPCIACNQGCIGGLFRAARMGCTVNPAVGRELALSEDLITATRSPRRVLVVGGGPAGLEAARVAALMGHRVTLAEARPSLGGTINIARLAPHLRTIGDITYWLEQEVYRLSVEVRLGTYMDADDVRRERADVVIVATGSMPRLDGFQLAHPGFSVSGTDLPHVISSHDVFTRPDLLQFEPGRSALVLDTVGHLEGLAVVEYLLSKGVTVNYVSHTVSFAPYVQTTWRDVPALERFYRSGTFSLLLRHQLVKIHADRCIVRPLQAAPDQSIAVAADTVVLVTQNTPLRDLHDELKRDGAVVHLVGDARSPRDLQAAISEAHTLVRSLG